MDLENKYSYGGIDCFRLIAAILVIAVHTSPLLNISGYANLLLTRIIARVAVPFFFMTTGYFMYQKTSVKDFNIKRHLIKIGKVYVLAIILYLPINVYMGYFYHNNLLLKIVKDILLNGTLYHLWFMPALMTGICIVHYLLKKYSYYKTFIVVTILYFFALLGDSYSILMQNSYFLHAIFTRVFIVFNYTRNGILFAPLFIFMGVTLSKKNKHVNKNIAKLGLTLSFTTLIVEGIILHNITLPLHDSMYIALIPTMFFLYQLILTVHITIPKILRRMSLIIYLIHPLVIVLIRAFAKIINNEYLVDNNLVFFVLVTILSIFISYIFCKITEDKQPQNLKSRAWAEINLKNLQHNYQEIKNILPNSCEFMAVVKANAYGHGSIKVAKTLQKLGCNSYAVASINEAIELRKARIKGDILILGYTSFNDLYKLNKYNLIQTAVDYNYAKQLNSFNNNIRTHLKLDTGMHRLGEDYKHIKTIENMLKLSNIIVEGIYTHLCVADSLSVYNIKYSEFQIENFYQVLQKLKSLGLKIPKHHIQSSYGVVNYPELKCDYARVGIFLYGSKSQVKDEVKIELNLKPLLSVKARISAIKKIPAHQPIGYGRKHIPIKDSTIATLTIGYADGIPRNLNNAYVLVKDQKAPIIGLICMDQMTVDISNINNVNQGDIVTILGVDINKEISALQLATSANIITNELYSRLGERLNRIYV